MLAFLFIVVYLALVLLRPQEYPQWVDSGIPFLPIALALASLAWLVSRRKRFDAPQYLLLTLFLLTTCVSLMLTGWMGGAMDQFTVFAPTLLAFVLLANAIDSSRRSVLVMTVFVVSALVLALHGVEQAAQGVGWTGMPLVDDGRIQYVGIFSDPNDLGMLFVICMPMAILLSSRGGLFGLRRLFWLGACLLLLYGVYLTNSRGALLAVVAMTGVYVWQRRGPVTAGILGVGSLLVLQLMPSRLQELDVSEASAMGRVDAWYEGMQMFISNPFFGVGTGRFTDYHHLTAHNSIILVLAENGFIGFTIWFTFVGYCFWMMLRILRHSPTLADAAAQTAWRRDRAIALTLLISLSGFFASAFFLSRSYVILLYLLAALVVGHFGSVRDRFPDLAGFELRHDLLRWIALSALATVGFYSVLKVLLALG